MTLDIKKLDRTVPIPLYFQLKSIILKEIKNGNFPVGSSIPTENELHETFHISRTTVRQAINELRQEGWLYRESTKGTFVTKPKQKETLIRSSEPFNQQILRTGQVPRTEVGELKVIQAPEELAKTLQIDVGDKVIYMMRRRFADEIPIVLMQNYLPYEICKFILEHDFTVESLYEVLSTKEETKVCNVNRRVEALKASSEEAELLNIKIKNPILCFTSVAQNTDKQVVETSVMSYRGDMTVFEVNVSEE